MWAYAGDYDTLGLTENYPSFFTNEYTVTNVYKDPFVIYHEMAHVLNWGGSEELCDEYAHNRTGYFLQ